MSKMKPPEETIREIKCGKEDEIRLRVGDVVSHYFHRHGSVGEDADFKIEDESILSHVKTECEYVTPEKMKRPGWTGGDAERCMWYFKAEKPGTTKLTVLTLFRFEVEEECQLKVKVV